MKQHSFSSLDHAHKKKRTKREIFLYEMDTVVPWDQIEALIAPHYNKPRRGRPQMPLSTMLRIYFLQQWYGLSDPGAEEALYDIHAMREFASLELGSDAIPDETTILNFRHLLEREGLAEALFDMVKIYLEERSLLLRGGTIMDATLIAAAIPRFTVEDGETVFEAIERVCRIRSALATTNLQGALVITNAAADKLRFDVTLREGENILAARATASNLERYRSYQVLAQHPATACLPDGFFAEADAEAIDTGVARHRPLTILAEQAMSRAETEPRARWESNIRAARSRTVRLSVAGSGTAELGALWGPGRLVRVESERLDVAGDLLIARTQCVFNEQGTQTHLELVLPGAFTAEPQIQAMDLGGWL